MTVTLSESQVGLFNADGSIGREAFDCAISGQTAVGRHGVLINLGNSAFVRVLTEQYHRVTDEWTAEAKAFVAPAPQVAAPVEPRHKKGGDE